MDLKYLKQVMFYFFSVVLSLILLYYVCYHLFDGFAETVTTVPAQKVTQSDVLTLDGYLFRDEAYVYSKYDGEVSYLCADGEKLSAGMAIAQVYDVSNPEVRQRIKELDEKIVLYESSNSVKGVTASDTSAIDKQIDEMYQKLKESLNAGDAETVYRKQTELLILLNQRKIITHAVDGYDRQIAELKVEKQKLISMLDGKTETVYMMESGYFDSKIDGYEQSFDMNALDTMTVERFEELICAEPSVADTSGRCRIGKTIGEYRWRVAVTVTRDQARAFTEGGSYLLRFPFNADAEFSMRLVHVSGSVEAGKTLLVFETGENPRSFNFLRMQTVQIVQQEVEGYRVPVSAVRVVNGVHGVYILHGDYVRFRAIEPLSEKDGYLIVRGAGAEVRDDGIPWLEIYDEIITEGKELYDGKVIK